jgi:hypothetical protein
VPAEQGMEPEFEVTEGAHLESASAL